MTTYIQYTLSGEYNQVMDEAILYVIYNHELSAIKIGISSIDGKRFASHRTKGWKLVCYWHFFERDRARQIESLVVKKLRDKHGHFLSKEDMPQNGYTETFSSKKVSKKAIIRMINKSMRSLALQHHTDR